MKLTKTSIVKFTKTFACSVLLMLATILVSLNVTHASKSTPDPLPSETPKVIKVHEQPAKAEILKKPKHLGANWDNSKSYTVHKVRYQLKDKNQAINHKERGRATWYCCYRKGTKTADGSLYSQHKLTAAHKTLPFGSKVRVTNLKNGKSVIVEITDRGPFHKGNIIDLTPAAFAKIDSKSLGVANVKLDVLGFKY